MKKVNRRKFLQTSAAGAAVLPAVSALAADAAVQPLHLACNQYAWFTFYRREQREFGNARPEVLSEVAAAGFQGYEPSVESPAALEQLAPALQQHQLEMRSLYVNSLLHDPDKMAASLANVREIARPAKERLGTKIVVTNPSPIRWGGPENKSDEQLQLQAKALDELGAELRGMGLVLAYHNHDIELRAAAREFHHMLLGTDPAKVTLCLDAHWVYRGAGNSSVALFDIVKLYGRRVTELHLRQSRAGVWTEAFEDGDIDYRELAKRLQDLGVEPHLVLEQSLEQGSPKSLDVVAAHRRSCEYAREVFAAR